MSMAHTKYGNALIAIKKNITSGIPFHTAFAKITHFSPYVLGWLSVANTHGSINDICGNIRDHYALKDDKIREIATKLIEPAVIVLTGIYIFIIMVTVILPILTYAGGTI
jgi:type II secretory pathway component PulF